MSRTQNTRARRDPLTNPDTIAAAATSTSLRRFLELTGSPRAFALLLDDMFMCTDHPANRSYEELRDRFLRDTGRQHAAAQLYQVVEQLEDFCLVEEAIRNAAFTMAFAVASRLVTGRDFLAQSDAADARVSGGAQ